jgi:hypothetical protein
MEIYCSENMTPFKLLLPIDNTPGHPKALMEIYMRLMYSTPADTTSILQPMDQEAISTLKPLFKKFIS